MAKDFTSTRLTPNPCRNCGDILDTASALDHKIPKPGDISLCFNCGEIGIFDENLVLQKPHDEVILLMKMPQFTRIRLLEAQSQIRHRGRIR